MPHRSFTRRRSPLYRVVRSQWTRCVLAVALIPILILAAFGGTTFFAHAHDGHGSHLHAARSVEDARLSAAQHQLAHAVGTATCEYPADGPNDGAHADEFSSSPSHGSDLPAPLEEPTGLIITIPDNDHLASRGMDWSQQLHVAQVVHDTFAWLWTPPHVAQEEGSPGGSVTRSALHLSSLTASQRLVRTSKALLI